MAQEQVQLEFVEELQEIQMIQQQMQAAGAQNPAMMGAMTQNPHDDATTQDVSTDYK